MMSSGKTFEVSSLGVFKPRMSPVSTLRAGEVGYVMAAVKNVADSRVGDTITEAERPAAEPLPGYKHPKAYGLLRAVSQRQRGIP